MARDHEAVAPERTFRGSNMGIKSLRLYTTVQDLSVRTRLEMISFFLLLITTLSTSYYFYCTNLKNLKEEIAQASQRNITLFNQLIENESESLARALSGYVQDEAYLIPFSQKDRNKLANLIVPKFAILRNRHNITHVYFVDTAGVVFLRAHKPEQYGDQLERATYLSAASTKNLSCGIEMGKNFFSLRCIRPVYLHDEFIGYMEMAEEIDHIFSHLKETTGADFGLLLSAQFVQQSGVALKTPRLGDFSLLYSTNRSLMTTVLPKLDLASGIKQFTNEIIGIDRTNLAIGMSPFNDAFGNTPGVLVSINDISRLYRTARLELLYNIASTLLIIISSIILFVFAIKRAFVELERQLEERTRRIKFMAMHDDLTGLPNRSMFTSLVNHNIQLAKRYNRTFALLFIDLDGFKSVNDTLGHDAGDQLLVEVSARLMQCVRESDVVARLGGDEFILLVHTAEDAGVDPAIDRVNIIAKRILKRVSESYQLSGRDVWVTASIGISQYPINGIDENELIKYADAAMYVAKETGKNNIQCYSDEIHRQSFERQALEAEIRSALNKKEFQLYYQAKMDIKNQTIVGMEALIRWNHPQLGVVEPSKFISIAEETGLILPIGKWVIRSACEQNLSWQKEGISIMPIAVNLSARQFNDENLLADIESILSDTGMPAEYLVLEITESMLIQDMSKAKTIIQSMKDLGVGVAIDDLGIGYSSFSSLGNFPIDSIKIDKSFIQELTANQGRSTIAEAIISMGNKLGLTVIAEGVETEEQLDFLRRNDCAQLQGFYFNRPMPATRFIDFLREQYARNSNVNHADLSS